MLTKEREKEIREELRLEDGGGVAEELLAELDRVREENESWRDTVRDQEYQDANPNGDHA